MKFAFAIALSIVSLSAHAVNKCTDPKTGKVTYSDAPCASAQQSTKMEWAPSFEVNVVEPPARTRRAEPDPAVRGPAEASQLVDLYKRWIDAEKLAGSTARVALAGPVGALQELRRQAEAVQAPSCLTDTHKSLVKLLGASVDSYLSFMRQDRDLRTTLYHRVDRDTMIRSFEGNLGSANCKA